MSKRWYVVHAYSGFEKSVQRALGERIQRSDVQDLFGQILVPVEEVVELKAGQKSRLAEPQGSHADHRPGFCLRGDHGIFPLGD